MTARHLAKELWEAVRAASTESVVNGNLSDPNLVNYHFAAIATDHLYNPQDVLQYCAVLQDVNQDFLPLFEYEIAQLLSKVRHTSSGLDDLPYWLFQKCSFELATELSDYMPINATPILSRLAEKIFVQQWLRPALPMELLKDQYAFRPTGSTLCAVVDFIHHCTLMLENNSYIRCLFIDFSKAFDVVHHSILLSKIRIALNWIIAFLTGRSQVCKISDGRFCDPQPITSSIVQGSGIGPTLWLIMESDLHPLSDANVIFKYADDTNIAMFYNWRCMYVRYV